MTVWLMVIRLVVSLGYLTTAAYVLVRGAWEGGGSIPPWLVVFGCAAIVLERFADWYGDDA